mgnify:CR=1 FL=1
MRQRASIDCSVPVTPLVAAGVGFAARVDRSNRLCHRRALLGENSLKVHHYGAYDTRKTGIAEYLSPLGAFGGRRRSGRAGEAANTVLAPASIQFALKTYELSQTCAHAPLNPAGRLVAAFGSSLGRARLSLLNGLRRRRTSASAMIQGLRHVSVPLLSYGKRLLPQRPTVEQAIKSAFDGFATRVVGG